MRNKRLSRPFSILRRWIFVKERSSFRAPVSVLSMARLYRSGHLGLGSMGAHECYGLAADTFFWVIKTSGDTREECCAYYASKDGAALDL